MQIAEADLFIGVTDYDWYSFLSSQPKIDEVNFWQPSGSRGFKALRPGEPFLFKLHSPNNYVVGGGFYVHWTSLPLSLAWETFGEKNGASSLEEMAGRIKRYARGLNLQALHQHNIGCIVLTAPFFFERSEWIPIPKDWQPNIVQGKTYSIEGGPGRELWEKIKPKLVAKIGGQVITTSNKYGTPIMISPRLGQGAFRVLVTDAYHRQCAMTGERVLPALEAAHIKPFAREGPNMVSNGLLLRSDIHRLFDRGYISVTKEFRVDISKKIREEFQNGREYYAFRGRQLILPESIADKPSSQFIEWHNQNVFLS